MERRVLISIVLSMAFLVGYQLVILKLYPPIKSIQQPVIQDVTELQQKKLPVENMLISYQQPLKPEETAPLENSAISLRISSHGGTVKEVVLRDYLDPTTHQPTILTRPSALTQRLGALAGVTLNGQPLVESSYTLTRDRETVVATATLAPGLQISKRYHLERETVLVGELRLTNRTAKEVTIEPAMIVVSPLDAMADRETRNLQGLALVDNRPHSVSYAKALKAPHVLTGAQPLAGQVSQYFALIASWDQPAQQLTFQSGDAQGLHIAAQWAPQTLPPGETLTLPMRWYAGTRSYRQIAAAGTSFAHLFPQGLLGTLGEWLVTCLHFFFRLTHNYGVAILLLTLMVSLLLSPLTWLNLRLMRASTAKMQTIQPKLERLKAQYKDSPQKLNQETLALYKQHGINPLAQAGGCLPMLLQFPIFIALYRTLLNSVELRGAPFLWIRDLANPDRAFMLGSFPVNLLPLLMAGAMFLQQKLSPMQATTTTPGMPHMTTIMTLMFAVMFYSLPSGLVLYWLTNTLVMSGFYLVQRPRTVTATA